MFLFVCWFFLATEFLEPGTGHIMGGYLINREEKFTLKERNYITVSLPYVRIIESSLKTQFHRHLLKISQGPAPS